MRLGSGAQKEAEAAFEEGNISEPRHTEALYLRQFLEPRLALSLLYNHELEHLLSLLSPSLEGWGPKHTPVPGLYGAGN